LIVLLNKLPGKASSLAARTPFAQQARAFDVTIELRAGSRALLRRMLARLPHAAVLTSRSELTSGPDPTSSPDPASRTYAIAGPDPSGPYRLYANSRKLAAAPNPGPLLEQLGRDAIIHVADHAPAFVFVHAGVVAWRGQALLFPGTSFAGKTTLVASLVRAGAIYYSDEYALLDDQGRVHPYARALQMRRPGRSRQRSVAVTQLEGVAGTSPIPVARIYFSRYAAGAAWNPEPMPPGLAALQMLPHTIPIRRTPSRVLKTLAAVTSAASCWASPRGDADATARAILAQL
jgi:hypothetical protein